MTTSLPIAPPPSGPDAPFQPHHEVHYITRTGWLRAAVLGANDGIVSTASLIMGVAASSASRDAVLLSGVAALVAGAMSMAAGEYVSVSSQADIEKADLEKESKALVEQPEVERQELADIYRARGLDDDLAHKVAEQLMKGDALAAHARDELGISEAMTARPLQAAFTSGLTFTLGAAAPLAIVPFAPMQQLFYLVPTISLLYLALLGWLGARTGGAQSLKAILRVTFWGALAMAVTAGIGRLVGTVV